LFVNKFECGQPHRVIELRVIVPTAELPVMAWRASSRAPTTPTPSCSIIQALSLMPISPGL
jgi:hypothetical protein